VSPRPRARSTLSRWFVASAWLLALGFSEIAQAHPHVRFSYRLEPVRHDGALTALKVHWTLDAATTVMAYPGIDINRNGVLDPEELEAFARQNDRLLAPNQYFLHLNGAGEALPFVVSRTLDASFQAQRIRLSFEVRLARPTREPVSVRLFDATWYVALTAEEPLLVSGDGCRADAQQEVVTTQGWGAQPVPVVRLVCASD